MSKDKKIINMDDIKSKEIYEDNLGKNYAPIAARENLNKFVKHSIDKGYIEESSAKAILDVKNGKKGIVLGCDKCHNPVFHLQYNVRGLITVTCAVCKKKSLSFTYYETKRCF